MGETSDQTSEPGYFFGLTKQAALWRTPTVGQAGGGMDPALREARGQTVNLKDQVSGWNTPRARDGKMGGKDCLETQAGELWATPRAAERQQHNSRDAYVALSRQMSRSSLPAQATSPAGATSSPNGRTSRPRLNPAFVEWLMGWPDGWTACAPAEMGSYLYKQRMQLVCLLINWMFIGDATC